jgi:hypothetical protein
MKRTRLYTARGTLDNNTVKRIPLWDGKFNTGYRVISFVVLPSDTIDTNADVVGCLATESASATRNWDLGDQRQIGWSGNKVDPLASTVQNGLVDPDNFIVEDLYVYGTSGDNSFVNYMIIMEKLESSDWFGALSMTRNKAQDA